MPVRTKRLVADRFGNGSIIDTMYTASPDETTIVKDWIFYNRSGASRTFTVSHVPSGGTGTAILVQTLADKATLHLDWWLVLQPGDTLKLVTQAGDGADSIYVVLSGTELEGVAD